MSIELLKSISAVVQPRGIFDIIILSHSSFESTYRLINDTKGIVIEGEEYSAFPFAITLTPKGEITGASITFSNIDRLIAEEVTKAMQVAPDESISCEHWNIIVERDSGDYYETSYQGRFELVTPEITKESISAGLMLRSGLPYNASSIFQALS